MPTNARSANCDDPVGRLVSIEGTVRVSNQTARLNTEVCPGEFIKIGANTRAALLLFHTDTIVRLDDNTEFVVLSKRKETPWVKLYRGIIHLFSKQPRMLSVDTPFVNAAVEGTEFLVSHTQRAQIDKTEQVLQCPRGQWESNVLVIEGAVGIARNVDRDAKEEARLFGLTQRQLAYACDVQQEPPQPPQRIVGPITVKVDPLDAVQWALYYPPLRPEDETQDVLAAVDLLYRGLGSQADERLREIGESDATALAYRSIIAVTQNRAPDALTLAQDAIETDPDSAVAYLARSYAQQAQFDLKRARDSVFLAIEKDERNAVAWARLAELQQSLGDTRSAQKSAEKAVSISPNVSLTQSVLGFVYLSRGDIGDLPEPGGNDDSGAGAVDKNEKSAVHAFTKAISLDTTDPLPRLGLGLAMIRKGKLREGREQLEIALSLDPNSSLVRSYLGKAYFEEKRELEAGAQYELAKTLDDRDPTPYFYDAVRTQALNQPVSALDNIQTSIELNGNRAVYRSRFQLDEDEAARGVSQARIYDDLGFGQLSLLEGAKSVIGDQRNYSAHRLLADAYLNRPRHEIARVSELLQSQLRQPLNLNPVQTQLADTRLGVLNEIGPFSASSNEFSRLFSSDGWKIRAGLVGGNKGTYGGETQVSWIGANTSLDATLYEFDTNGVRQNNQLDQESRRVFLQHRVSESTSVQMELVSIDIDEGDPFLGFDETDFSALASRVRDISSIRLGFHRRSTNESELLAAVRYEELDDRFEDTPLVGIPLILSDNTKGWQAELQWVTKRLGFDLVSGIGHFDASRKAEIMFAGTDFGFESMPRHSNAYVYANRILNESWAYVVGGSFDDFRGGIRDREQVNPKFGFIWNDEDRVSVRGAAFRVLKRSLISNQTIEPTNLVGFNQFFDDTEATESRVLAFGVDLKPGSGFWLGAEVYDRTLKVPQLFVAQDLLVTGDLDELFARAYVYWASRTSWGGEYSIGFEYDREEFRRNSAFTLQEQIVELDTDRFGLSLNYFDREGWKVSLEPAYVEQKGLFVDRLFSLGLSDRIFAGSDKFWIADLSVEYRLPRQKGVVGLTVTNLFDKKFQFQDTDPLNPSISSVRRALLRVTINF